jgi:hypothetical protein
MKSAYLFYPEGVLSRELLGEAALLNATSRPRMEPGYTTYILNNFIQTAILPLFAYNSFSEILTRHEWESIDLACRLASHFFTDHNMLHFWTQICCGRVEQDWSQGEEVEYLDFTNPTNPEELDRCHKDTRSAIGKLARRLKYTAMPSDGASTLADKYAYTKAYVNQESGQLCVGIHTDALKHIKKITPKASSAKRVEDPTSRTSKPPQWKNTRSVLRGDQEEQFYEFLRFQLVLACSLVDQAAAVFFHFTHTSESYTPNLDRQPFFSHSMMMDTDPLPLRQTWQMFALGCKVEQWHNNYKFDAKGKIREVVDVPTCTFLYTRNNKETGVDRSGDHITLLPTEWIVTWFLRPMSDEMYGVWQSELQITDLPRYVALPKVGKAGILVCKQSKIQLDGKNQTVNLWTLEKYNHEDLVAAGGSEAVKDHDQGNDTPNGNGHSDLPAIEALVLEDSAHRNGNGTKSKNNNTVN